LLPRRLAGIATLVACLTGAPSALLADEPLTMTASALPTFDRSVPDNRFGPLTYLGGLALDSSNRHFEAVSGLTMAGDQLIMVTDEGHWITATLQSDAAGAPTGLTDARIGALLNTDGSPMLTKRLADAEAVTVVGDDVWVTSERNQPIRAYELEDGHLTGAARLPFGDAAPLSGNRNQGLEAMVHITAGPLAGETLIFLEEPPRQAANPTAMRLLPDGSQQAFAVRRQDDYAITGAAMMPDGDVMLVERRFRWNEGIYMRLRHLPAEDISSGAVEGRIILEADGATQIDNMEGIAVIDHPDGSIITLISDDNSNFFQRTVLLRFQVTGDLSIIEGPRLPNPVARPDL
jgi:hypothetical protein